jgi:hypothetical protein
MPETWASPMFIGLPVRRSFLFYAVIKKVGQRQVKEVGHVHCPKLAVAKRGNSFEPPTLPGCVLRVVHSE